MNGSCSRTVCKQNAVLAAGTFRSGSVLLQTGCSGNIPLIGRVLKRPANIRVREPLVLHILLKSLKYQGY